MAYLKTLNVTRLRFRLEILLSIILTVLSVKTLFTMRQKCVIVGRVFKCARKKVPYESALLLSLVQRL